jgi:hypothetical protein
MLRQALNYSGLEAASCQQTELILSSWSEYAADVEQAIGGSILVYTGK